MNSEIARERKDAVLRPDTITVSQGDFLGTHVAVKRLKLPGRFAAVPSGGRDYTEGYVYKNFVLNPENRHQFVAVYGQSGTGKSHLIRWFEAKYRSEKPENEVVLFIRRSDNTLKGTIRQLLSKEEVKSIGNRDLYERLVKTSQVADEGTLKGRIYYEFVNRVENDSDSRGIRLSKVTRDRLASFLKNDLVKEHLMAPDGPFERIYSKVAEHTAVDRDTVAEFRPEDFRISAEFGRLVIYAEPDRRAERYIRALMADEDGPELTKKTADYLNQFVNEVIQESAGIMPGDFRDIFLDIRRDLYRQGKNLTLFIEDITSFTGVDDALLDALIVENTGMNENENLCRISSFIGTTSGYLENNFRDNHRDRITQYVYIPDNPFDEDGVVEFVGRYLNTISLPAETLAEWAGNRSEEAEYPVHQATEGAKWDCAKISYGKKLSLYPFTRNAVLYLYRNQLAEGKRTPRYVIRDIIEPAVSEILLDRRKFPGDVFREKSLDTRLSLMIMNQVPESRESDRLRRFLTIWGDGSGTETENEGIVYFCGIRREILDELGFPSFTLQKGEYAAPERQARPQQPAEPDDTVLVSEQARDRVSAAEQALLQWKGGGKLNLSSTGGTSGTLRAAQDEINRWLYSVVNWLAAGISQDNMSKIKNSNKRLVSFASQTKNNVPGFYEMQPDMDSVHVISAFVRYREYGESSWNYPGAEEDVYTAALWTERIKDTLVEAVRDTVYSGTSYIEAAAVAEVYRQIMRGEFADGPAGKVKEQLLRSDSSQTAAAGAATGHSDAWKKLLDYMGQDGREAENRKTVRQYFDLPQGEGGRVLVLNDLEFTRTVQRLKKNGYEAAGERGGPDPVKGRQDVFAYYDGIRSRMSVAAEAEQKRAEPLLSKIRESFDGEEIGEKDIRALADAAENFYKTVSDAGINITYYNGGAVKKGAEKIAKAIRTAEKGMGETNPLEILMTFSADPLLTVEPLLKLLERLEKDFEKADREIAAREKNLEAMGEDDGTPLAAMDPGQEIEKCLEILGLEVAE